MVAPPGAWVASTTTGFFAGSSSVGAADSRTVCGTPSGWPTVRFSQASPVRTLPLSSSCTNDTYTILAGSVVHSALAVVDTNTTRPSPSGWTVIAGSAAGRVAALPPPASP